MLTVKMFDGGLRPVKISSWLILGSVDHYVGAETGYHWKHFPISFDHFHMIKSSF